MPKKIKLEVFLDEYAQASDLPKDSQILIAKAKANLDNAYAPYSKFKVSAAVLLENGQIILGTNQENSAFPSGLCAERVALFYASAGFPDLSILKIGIVATTAHSMLRPCGGCLQVLAEYQSRQELPIEIIMESSDGTVQVASSVDMLLPFTFSFNHKD